MYDKNATYDIPFIGGPYDGKTLPLIPADRLIFPQKTPNGTFLKNHTYNLREHVHPETGEVTKLEYVYAEKQ